MATVNLDPIDESVLYAEVRQAIAEGYSDLYLVLTNGDRVYACLPPKEMFLFPRDVDEPWFGPEGLLVAFPSDESLVVICIPSSLIAGVQPVSIKQAGPPNPALDMLLGRTRDLQDEDRRYAPHARVLLDDLLAKAKAYGFPMWTHEVLPVTVAAGGAPKWGPLRYGTTTYLYTDWDYFTHRSGGLEALGISTPLVGFSVGAEQSLWDQAEKKLGRDPKRVDEVCRSAHVVIRAFPVFPDLDALPPAERAKWKEFAKDLEGDEWEPVFLTEARVKDGKPVGAWVFALFRGSGPTMLWPRALWDSLDTPIRVLGDVGHVRVETQFGEAMCVLKIRAVAHRPEDERF